MVVREALKIPLSSQAEENMTPPVITAYLNRFGLAATERSVRQALSRKSDIGVKQLPNGSLVLAVKAVNKVVQQYPHCPQWMRGPRNRQLVPPVGMVTVVEASGLYAFLDPLKVMVSIESGKLKAERNDLDHCHYLSIDIRDLNLLAESLHKETVEKTTMVKRSQKAQQKQAPALNEKENPPKQAEKENELLTIRDATDYMSMDYPCITEAKLRYRIKRGRIKAREKEGVLMISENELDRIIKENPGWLHTKVATTSTPGGYLSLSEAAEKYNVDTSMLKEAIESGSLPSTEARKVGRGYRHLILEDELILFLGHSSESEENSSESGDEKVPVELESREANTSLDLVYQAVGRARHLLDRYELALKNNEDLVEALGDLII